MAAGPATTPATDMALAKPGLSPEAWQAVEDRLEPFEADWAAGRRPRIADYLDADDGSGGRLLVELVLTDLEYRLKAGGAVRVDGYLEDFPRLREIPGAAEVLVATETRLRERLGPNASGPEPGFGEAGLLTESFGGDDTRHDGDAAIRGGLNGSAFPAVPGYEVVGEFGRGGMGVVYEAVERKLKRTVALKTLRPGADPEERDRLRREAEAAAALTHPNVVPVYRVFDHAGRLYVASEHQPGGTLADRLADGPLESKAAAAVLEPVARAVAYAHSKGIVHRDLKPQNVLLAADDAPKVADFGLAKRLDDSADSTRTGVITGSPSYMAPEQAAARKDVGPAADVWALGAVIYELLTGRPPFRAATALETLELVRSQDPVPPRRLVPAIPRDLETICLKCLEKDPARRYLSADELADDFARFRRGEAISARPVGRVGLAARWAKRHPAVAALSAALALALLAGTGTSLAFARRSAAHAETSAKNERSAKRSAERAREKERAATESERHIRRLLFAADMLAAGDAASRGDPLRVEELLAAHEPERDGPYAFVWSHLDRLAHAPGGVFDRFDGEARSLAVSPDGTTLAAGGSTGEVRLYDAKTLRRTVRLGPRSGGPEADGLAFSPDGTRIAEACGDGTVALWDLSGGRELWRVKAYDTWTYRVAFALDGAVLAVSGYDAHVKLLDPATGETVASLDARDKAVFDIAVGPDGRTLVAAGAIRASGWDLTSRSEVWAYERQPNEVDRFKSVALSADGGTAAIGTIQAELLLVRNGGGRTSKLPLIGRGSRDAAGSRSLRFLPDGSLVVGSDDGLVRSVPAEAVADSGAAQSGTPAAAPTAAAGGPVAGIPGPSRTAWVAHHDRVTSVAVGKDGRVFTASRDGGIAAWRPAEDPAWYRVTESRGKHEGDGACVWLPGNGETRRLATFGPQRIAVLEPSNRVERPMSTPEIFWHSLAADADGRRIFAGGCVVNPLFDEGVVYSAVRCWEIRPDGLRDVWSWEDMTPTPTFLGNPPAGGRWIPAYVNVKGDAPDLVRRLDAATGHTLAERVLIGGGCTPAVPADGSFIAVADGSAVLLLTPETLEPRATLHGHTKEVKAVAVSTDGRKLASCDDGLVVLWDPVARREIRKWRPEAGDTMCLDFSPDGALLLTGSLERPPRVWDVETGRLLLTPDWVPDSRSEFGTTPEWGAARFSPDGLGLIVGRTPFASVLDGRPLRRSDHRPSSPERAPTAPSRSTGQGTAPPAQRGPVLSLPLEAARWDAIGSPGAIVTGAVAATGDHGPTEGSRAALSFGGAGSRVEVPLDVPPTEFAVSLWFKTTDPDSGIFSVTSEKRAGPYIDVFLAGGHVHTARPGTSAIASKERGFADGRWHHVVHTFGVRHLQRLYVDGDPVGYDYTPPGGVPRGRMAHLGLGNGRHLTGHLDDVTIWDRPLSAEEVRWLASGRRLPVADARQRHRR